MDRYPYAKPPRWWPPRPNRLWINFWRPVRRYQQRHDYRVARIDVAGLDYVRRAIQARHGVLITPNHAGHADCFLLLEALLRLRGPSYIMTAWQVFQMMPRWQQIAYCQHGCFSVDREGQDLRALRQAMKILVQSSRPLVIFPEGEVYHLNDHVMPFRDSTLMLAAAAVRQAARPVACIPCALKYFYIEDPTDSLKTVVLQLEGRLAVTRDNRLTLAQRVERLQEYALRWREQQYLGKASEGPLEQRRDGLVDQILQGLEKRHKLANGQVSVPQRVTSLRQRLIAIADASPTSAGAGTDVAEDLEDVFVAVQLYSYAFGYVAQAPTIERIAETVDKLEEDVLGAQTAGIRGRRRGIVQFGPPLILDTPTNREFCQQLSDQLQSRVQDLLDNL